MLSEVPDGKAIRKATERLLRKAAADGRLPTPVDDIVAAAGLVEPEHSMLSNFVMEQAPAHIQRAFRKVSGRVQAVLDRKAREIHIDPAIRNDRRAAYRKLHEVTHDILPWQRKLGYAEDAATFLPSMRKTFEWQANQGAAELLFQGDLFTDMAGDYATNMAAVLELASLVGASAHAAFRRYVEVHRSAVAGVVMDLSPCSRDPLAYRRHEVICSQKWESRFGPVRDWPWTLRAQPYAFVNSAQAARRTGEAISADVTLPDLRNDAVHLRTETYCNQYKLFVLIWVPRRELLQRQRIIAPSTAATR